MTCPECGRSIPDESRFCYYCGVSPRRRSRDGEGEYRVAPAEQVSQLALISTIMPHTDRRWADHYRWALAAGALAVMVLAMTGLTAPAVAAGALLLPAAYGLYLAESGVWQRSAGTVIALALALPAAIALVVTVLVLESPIGRELRGVLISAQTHSTLGGLPLGELLALALVFGLVVAVGTNLGPILHARRPAFDDLLDGFTFGVAAGIAYSAAETIVFFRDVFFAAELQAADPVAWAAILVQAVLVKPIVYALAAGLAVSVFSGRGEGYEGFGVGYVAAFGVGVVMIAIYWLGLRLLALSLNGPVLGVVWGLIVVALLVLRARRTLQDGLMEKAIHEVRERWRMRTASSTARDCAECGMPMVPGSAFCASCGVSVRATAAGLEARAVAGRALQAALGDSLDDAPARLGRSATVVVLVTAVVLGAGGGMVGAAAFSRPAAIPSSVGEASFLPIVGRQIPAAAEDLDPGEAVTPDISIGGTATVDGPHVALAAGEVVLPLTGGWRQAAGDGRTWSLLTADGRLWLFAWLQAPPAAAELVGSDAALRTYFEDLFSADPRVANVATSIVRPLQPFGRVVDRSMLSYRATYADGMLTSEFRSNLYVGVRNDGTLLVVEVRAYPGSDWDAATASWFDALYRPAWESFARAALPPPQVDGSESAEVED